MRCFLLGVSSETPPTATRGVLRCSKTRDARRVDAGLSGEGLCNDPPIDPLTLWVALRVLKAGDSIWGDLPRSMAESSSPLLEGHPGVVMGYAKTVKREIR